MFIKLKTLEDKSKSNNIIETPLMKQYFSIKGKYPDAILLFRVGDFYETFNEDAVTASKILGIVLAKRANGSASFVDLAGFPYHSLDSYLHKLVKAGYRVAICEQLEDPKLTKKIVKRGVTEVVTPGLALNDKILDNKSNNFLAGIHIEDNKAGVSFLDISTGEMYVSEGTLEYIDKLFQGFIPSEIIIQKNKQKVFNETFGDKYYTNNFEDWVFKYDYAFEKLTNHFGTLSLKGFGVENLNNGIIAAGAIFHYLAETQYDRIKHISKIARIDEDNYVWLDRFTIRNLEILQSPNENALTLTEVIDQSITPMGSRLMKRWIVMPLKSKSLIEERLNVVEFFIDNSEVTETIIAKLKSIGDIERLSSRISIGKGNPRELISLKKSLVAINEIKSILQSTKNALLLNYASQINNCYPAIERISKEISEDAPLQLNKGGIININVNDELDELRTLLYSGKDYLRQMQERESQRTGISSLKIAFNNVFGYYIEVRNTHKDKVPLEWIRKQTLKDCERYITEELKVYEEKILGAEEKILRIETTIFNELQNYIAGFIPNIQVNSSIIAMFDCLMSFAVNAKRNNFCKPLIEDHFAINIKNGRHPVIEKRLKLGEEYVANDVFLDDTTQQIMMITGPNMSGKSALLRQTAIIVLLAQMGSYVPADYAEIGIVDKIFSRVGASDNISMGESTFMVEMNETASILNNISHRSLILLDEIGRGTSTYDGISIAWAIAEFLHEHNLYKPKTLFATHYHELNEMSKSFSRIKNYNVSVKEINNKIIFLRKLQAGGSEHSFGIHVAKMAGMPGVVIDKSYKILEQLEKSHSGEKIDIESGVASPKGSMQLSFFSLDDPILVQIKEELLKTDIDTLSPIEALMKLNAIKKMIKT